MTKTLYIYNVDEQTHVKMRLLSIGKGLTMPQLLKQLVDNAYQTDETIPGKSQISKMRRFAKRLK